MEIKIKGRKPGNTPEKIAEVLKSILRAEDKNDQNKEHFWSIGVDSRNIIKYIELVSLGTLNAALVHPRETFRLAIIKSVSGIIVAHNHPSGDCEPSGDDVEITLRLKKAGDILGIELLDHIVIAKKFYSFSRNKRIV